MTAVETMSKRERNKAEKQRRIMEAAKHLFETNGFENTTTAEISELAGIGTGTLYLYVTSKEHLLVDVFWEDLGQIWMDALDSVDRTQPVLDQLCGLFEVISGYHAANPELSRTYFKELMFLPSDSAEGLQEIMRKVLARIEGLLSDAKMAGRLDEHVPGEALTRNLFGAWYYLMVQRYSDQISEARVAEYLRRSFSVALFGLNHS